MFWKPTRSRYILADLPDPFVGNWNIIINVLSSVRSDFKCAIFECVLRITPISISSANPLRWMTQGPTDDKSTLVQVMAWCPQATSHYLNQCWLGCMAPYGMSRPQWVNTLLQAKNSDTTLNMTWHKLWSHRKQNSLSSAVIASRPHTILQ